MPDVQRNELLIFRKFKNELDAYFTELASGAVQTQPTVSHLAARLFFNPSYLNTVVKGVSGKTASTFIQEKIILEAKSYLMHSDLQITEIAYKLGFANISYFNRLFKKRTGLSPTSFRKRHP